MSPEEKIFWGRAVSPYGQIILKWNETGDLTYLAFTDRSAEEGVRRDEKAQEIADLIFRHKYDPPLKIRGTAFQRSVWKVLQGIALGKTISYQDIATAIGKPKAVRAVGSAVGANPVSYLIPCHRVIRSDGSLGGYRWGLALKKLLLEEERRVAASSPKT